MAEKVKDVEPTNRQKNHSHAAEKGKRDAFFIFFSSHLCDLNINLRNIFYRAHTHSLSRTQKRLLKFKTIDYNQHTKKY